MDDLQTIFQATMDLFQQDFTLYGFTFSWWNVLLWVVVASLILRFIGRIFGD